jgi:hypothetical protein
MLARCGGENKMDLTQNELDQLRTAMNAELDRLIAARKPEVKQWPQVGDRVYTCTSLGDVVAYSFCGSMALPAIDRYLEIGNAFKTEAEAERLVEALKVQAELRRMPGVVAHERSKNIWFIGHSFGDFLVMYNHHSPVSAVCGVYFCDEYSAQYAFDKIGAKRLQLWLDDYLQTPIGGE